MVISEDKIADAFVHSWQIRLALWYIYHFVVLSHLKKRKGKGEGEKASGWVCMGPCSHKVIWGT